MKILVFGQTGQVATELSRLKGDHELIVLGRGKADLADPDAVRLALQNAQADAVINAAAYTAVDKAEDEKELAMRVNGHSVGAMAQVCAARGLPFVHISTDYVFDGTGTTPWQATDPVAPLGVYGASKLLGETLLNEAVPVAAILRTSWVFSAHGNNFVKTMLRLGKDRDSLSIVADQIGGPTPARDIAAACLRLAENLAGGRPGGTYHFSGVPDVSWADFARAIFQEAGLHVDVTDIPSSAYPTPAKRPSNSRLDCTSLEKEQGITRPNWRDGLRDVLKELS